MKQPSLCRCESTCRADGVLLKKSKYYMIQDELLRNLQGTGRITVIVPGKDVKDKSARIMEVDYDPESGQISELQKEEPTGDDRMEAIVNAIAELDEHDEKVWTADKKPEVKALEKVLGFDINAKERDAALKLLGA